LSSEAFNFFNIYNIEASLGKATSACVCVMYLQSFFWFCENFGS